MCCLFPKFLGSEIKHFSLYLSYCLSFHQRRKSQAHNFFLFKPSHSTWLITLSSAISAPPAVLCSMRARLQLGILCRLNLKSEKKASSPGGLCSKEPVGWSGGCAVISLVEESACVSGSCCSPGHRAQGIYTDKGSSIVVDLPQMEGPPCSDVIFND